MHISTRQKIIDHLRNYPFSSSRAICDVLGFSKENIQYHLKILLREGKIEYTERLASISNIRGRGHPVYLYSLKKTSYPANMNHLASTLFSELLDLEHHSMDENTLLLNLAKRMVSHPFPPNNKTQALRSTIQILNNHNYQVSWEARPSGPRIIFKNCPYAAIIEDHPQLCILDTLILNNMLESRVTMLSNIVYTDKISASCIFIAEI
jgi:predicted ArsR family transcriptional regulator